MAHQFVLDCSNGCENIFIKESQNKKINDLNVYVMALEMNASDCKKLQNISAFLKGEEFYDLQTSHVKKAKLFIGMPIKL